LKYSKYKSGFAVPGCINAGKKRIDLLKLFPEIPFQVIFITAHSQFAVEAIKFSAAGYVLKPIDDYELTYAVVISIGENKRKGNQVLQKCR